MVSFEKDQLRRRLAAEGRAGVLRAVASETGGFRKYVATKRILPHLKSDQQSLSVFLDEAPI